VVLYYVLPMNSALDTYTVLLLILYVAIWAALLSWRIREITQSDYQACARSKSWPSPGPHHPSPGFT
jgi:hypothetical protein